MTNLQVVCLLSKIAGALLSTTNHLSVVSSQWQKKRAACNWIINRTILDNRARFEDPDYQKDKMHYTIF